MTSLRFRHANTVVLTCLLVAAASSFASTGSADESRPRSRRVCVASYEKSQEQRKAGKLRRAREMLLSCARPACGKFINQECTKALAQIETDIPSVVLSAKNDTGEAIVDVEVTMDGEPLASRLDGRAVPVDPGLHQFAFKSPNGAVDLVRLPIAQGEHNRVLAADLKTPAPKARPDEATQDARSTNKEEASATPAPGSPSPMSKSAAAVPGDDNASSHEQGPGFAPYVIGGVGIAGLVGFGVLYSMAHHDNKELTKCWPTCPDSQVSSVQRKYTAGNVSLGVGIAALSAAAVWFYLDSKSSTEKPIPAPRYAFDVQPTPGGMFSTVSGSF